MHVGHDAAPRRRRSTRSRCRPRCRRATPRSGPPQERGIAGAAPGRDPDRHRRDPAHARGVGHPRQDDHVVDARPRAGRGRAAPVVHRGRRAERDRRRRGLVRRRVVRGRGRRERRHVRRARRRRVGRHERRGRPPRLLRRPRRRRGGLRPVPRPRRPGPNLVCADDPGAARLGARHGALHLRHRPRRRLRDRRPGDRAARQLVPPRPPRRRCSAGSSCPCPGLHNVRNATGRDRGRAAGRRGVRARAGRPGPLRRRGPPLPVPGRGRPASRWSTTTPTTPARCGRSSPPRRRAAGAGWSPSSSPTATRAPRTCTASSATRSSTPTWWCSPTCTPPGSCPGPA